MDSGATTIGFNFDESSPDNVIGPYKLIRQIGEGGMGVVYHAQQVKPIRRDVALKVIKPGMDTKQVIARFETERQALAVMDHPNIAHVFEAGTTAHGLPYFVMELVDGIPITQYCDLKRLTVRERIELFVPVCEAIQHAHQKGIIHRDIKPSNILIAENDGKPMPKVIDFGLAKALGYQLSDASLITNIGVVVGTPNYMSPEQAELTRQDVDTRADVYSLGAVLYELLTGTTPLKREGLESAAYVDVLRRIREEETELPSLRLRHSTTSVDTATQRRSDSVRLPKLLRGELDWITMRALEKDRTRRYETVNGFSRDLRRYIDGDAVEAGPPSANYRMRKFVGKHRVWLATGMAFAAILVLGIVITSWMAVRASRAERIALVESATSKAVNDFLQNDLLAEASAFAQARPDTRPDPDLKVRTALDRAASRIEGKFSSQPLLEASIRQTIGDAYMDLGLPREAQAQTERAVELRRRLLGEAHPDTLTSMSHLGLVYEHLAKYAQGAELQTKVLDTRSHVLGVDHPDTLRSMRYLAWSYYLQGKYAQAEVLYTKTLEAARRVFGPEQPDTLATMRELAVVYSHEERKYAQAEPLYAAVAEVRGRVLGPEHPETLRIESDLAQLYLLQGKYAQAEPLFNTVLEVQRRVLGEEHTDTLATMNNLAVLYYEQGKYGQSEQFITRTLEIRRRISGPEHRSTLILMNNLAELYNYEGKYEKAEALYDSAEKIAHRVLGDQHGIRLNSLSGLADTYQGQGKYAQAETLYIEVLGFRRRVQGEEHPQTLETMTSLGKVLLLQRKYADAESVLRNDCNGYQKAQADTWQRSFCETLLGASLAGQKKFAYAEPLLISGYNGLTQREAKMGATDRSNLKEAGERIVELYQEWGKPEKAAEWKQKIQPGNRAGKQN